jgi:glycosyltransferase involved in cell wall biosynthesis
LYHRKGGNFGGNAILDIKNQNRTIASIKRGSTDGYGHTSYTFTPNGETIISGGGNGNLTAYQRNGSKIGDYIGHTGDVMAVAVSADGRFLVSGAADQTVRLWNVKTRENLLTLFHGSNGEWVAWTNSGHYTSSPNGDKMIGWQINKGVDKAADYINATQLAQHFYRPDIINAAIKLGSAKQAVAQAQDTDFNLNMLTRKLPPKFQIISPHSGTRVTTGIVPIKLKIAANTVAIEKFMVNVNGCEVTPHRIRKMHPKMQQHTKTIEIPLETGNNRITIRAKNSIGTTSVELKLQYAGASQIRQGNLHAFFGIPCGFIAMLLGIPFIVSLRGSDVPFYSQRWYYLDIFIFRYLSKLIWYKAKKVVANSEGLKILALKTYSKKNISIIPNGVDTNIFYPAKNSNNGDVVILFVGRLIERKGVDTLITAFASLVNTIPCRLIIAGDGNQRTNLELLVDKLGISNYVDFLGVVEHKNLPEIYRKSDIYVLPSKNEGMSNTCLEAIASGLPIIMTQTGGTTELVKNNVNDLKIALLELLKDINKRQQFGMVSRKLAEQMSWHNVANAYKSLYK